MKISKYIPFLLITITSCSTNDVTTYKEGIKRCRENAEQKKLKNPHILVESPRDCIIGCEVPKLITQTISGQKIDENYFKGKISIINFWFEGCPPCVHEIPIFNKIVDIYGKKDINFIAIGRDSKEDIVLFLEKNPWDFEQIINGRELLEDEFQNIWGFPTTLIVDDEGIIVNITGGLTEKNQQSFIDMIQAVKK